MPNSKKRTSAESKKDFIQVLLDRFKRVKTVQEWDQAAGIAMQNQAFIVKPALESLKRCKEAAGKERTLGAQTRQNNNRCKSAENKGYDGVRFYTQPGGLVPGQIAPPNDYVENRSYKPGFLTKAVEIASNRNRTEE